MPPVFYVHIPLSSAAEVCPWPMSCGGGGHESQPVSSPEREGVGERGATCLENVRKRQQRHVSTSTGHSASKG